MRVTAAAFNTVCLWRAPHPTLSMRGVRQHLILCVVLGVCVRVRERVKVGDQLGSLPLSSFLSIPTLGFGDW